MFRIINENYKEGLLIIYYFLLKRGGRYNTAHYWIFLINIIVNIINSYQCSSSSSYMCTYNTLHQRQTAFHVIYTHTHIKHIHNNTLATLTFNCLTYKFTYIRREKTFLLSLLVVHFPTTYISTKKKNIKIISSIYTLTATIFFFNLREIIWLVNTIEKKKNKERKQNQKLFFLQRVCHYL